MRYKAVIFLLDFLRKCFFKTSHSALSRIWREGKGLSQEVYYCYSGVLPRLLWLLPYAKYTNTPISSQAIAKP